MFANFLLQHLLELLVLCIGLFMGMVFVFSGWRGSTKGVEFKNDPRVKGILWALGVFFATLMADWNGILGQGTIDPARLLDIYGIPFCLVAAFGVLAIAGGIFIWHARLKRSHPEDYPDEPFGAALDFLYYGYQYYKDEQERLLDKRRQDRFSDFQTTVASSSTSLAAMVLAVGHYLKQPTTELQHNLTEQLLSYMCLVVQSATGKRPLNASLMIAVARAQASEGDWTSTKYIYGDRKRFGYLLILKGYADPSGQEQFALPVEDSQTNQDWLDWMLPGAPEAFLRQTPLVVRTTKLDFAKEIPDNIRESIAKYFKGKQFKSFACLVVPGSKGALGIVNIESVEEHIFRESDEVQRDIAKLLQPSCSLLSLIFG
jgi:hypothetical protein